jgi:molecular chaperone DnaJ
METERTCDTCSGSGKIIKNRCHECKGSGKVRKTRKIDINVPAGIDNGHTISLRGEGEPGTRGGPPGDLLVNVRVKPHDTFIRNGTNVMLKVPISFQQAALGDEIKIPTIDGKVKYKIHEGTQPGDKFRMRGKGIPSLRSGKRGDQIVEIVVEVPKKLNRKQKAALKAYAEVMAGKKK